MIEIYHCLGPLRPRKGDDSLSQKRASDFDAGKSEECDRIWI
jgi:hypothetical protein